MRALRFSSSAMSNRPGARFVAAKVTYLICIISAGTFAYFSALLLYDSIIREQFH